MLRQSYYDSIYLENNVPETNHIKVYAFLIASNETSIVQKLVLGNPEMFTEEEQYLDKIPIFRHRNDDDDEIDLEHFDFEAANPNLSQNPHQDMVEVEDQDQHVTNKKEQRKINKENPKVLLKTKANKKGMQPSIPTSASIHKDILQQLRDGKYKVEIAPSDLVDFGGQRTYDMTHQLFIQHKGTFVLMFDGRFGLQQPLTEYLQQNMTAEGIFLLLYQYNVSLQNVNLNTKFMLIRVYFSYFIDHDYCTT